MTLDLDLNPIKARLNAAPELRPYATAKGGVVLLNGPFPYVKAYAAVVFVEHALTDLPALIQEVEAVRAAIRAMFDAPDLNAEVPARQAPLVLIGEG